MALFTLADVEIANRMSGLRRLADSSETQTRKVDAYFQEQATRTPITPSVKFDIFLSHAYPDKSLVAGIHSLLTLDGFTVYVDWIYDPQLSRQQVNTATANKLRVRMSQSRSLLYATTNNHINSKWMPWECGYFDGRDGQLTGTGHVAILPIAATPASTYGGLEYLGLYPYADKGSRAKRNLNICNQSNHSLLKTFDDWIADGHP